MESYNHIKSGQLVQYFLMASYLYYNLNTEPPMSDAEFDTLCRRLYDEWDDIKHYHKHLIDRESLKAGTGYYIKKYPTIVIGAAMHWVDTK